MPGLAVALNNLTYPLRAAGRRDDALAAADESVRLNRALAAARPKKYRYSLACSLSTQAEVLTQAGRLDDALDSVSEAADIYQDVHPRGTTTRARPPRSWSSRVRLVPVS